ncbi:MAG: hypothetical protein HQL06_15605 [Nitrospirae bacterium]|nr:hypothetical protein [Nitrospirota bacterium]
MIIQEFHQLHAEIATLDNLLKQLPEVNVIERMGLEMRKKGMEDLLASQPAPPREPTRVLLTFRGKPIVGSHGILAEFGAKAINAFADAVTAIGASQTLPLGTRGAIPNREEFKLLITGTALGSFGFELEEAPKDPRLFPEMSLVEPAIRQTMRIMKASLGSDEELTDTIADADPRAVQALRTFLKTMVDQEAVCTLDLKGEIFSFADVDQVSRSEGRLSQENIHEEEKTLSGHFLGVLPNHRTFEFLVEENGEVIFGKISNNIEEASQINDIIKKPVTITVHTKRAGKSRPNYALLDYKTNIER